MSPPWSHGPRLPSPSSVTDCAGPLREGTRAALGRAWGLSLPSGPPLPQDPAPSPVDCGMQNGQPQGLGLGPCQLDAPRSRLLHQATRKAEPGGGRCSWLHLPCAKTGWGRRALPIARPPPLALIALFRHRGQLVEPGWGRRAGSQVRLCISWHQQIPASGQGSAAGNAPFPCKPAPPPQLLMKLLL